MNVINATFSEIAIAAIISDTAAQIRADGTDPQVVGDYAEAMEQGAVFPPVVLFHDGADYFAADGFHRIAAAETIGRGTVLADVRQGTRRDAILHAVGANADHGLRRSQSDRRNAVLTLSGIRNGHGSLTARSPRLRGLTTRPSRKSAAS